jgi:hypothetical protein
MALPRVNKTDHELIVCEAAIEILALIHGKKLRITAKPDASDSTQPRCDFEAEGEGIHHVIEHTVIEAFPNRLRSDQVFEEIFGRINEFFPNGLGIDGRFNLVCHSRDELLAVKGWDKIRASLAAWVKAEAPNLAISAKESNESKSLMYPVQITAKPSGVPFEVTLKCREASTSKLLVSSQVPRNLEDQTRERLRTALNKKCPKLATWKKQYSTLVLEEADIALGNELSTAFHLKSLLSEIKIESPSYVVYVDSYFPNELAIHLLKDENSLDTHRFLFWNPTSKQITGRDTDYD